MLSHRFGKVQNGDFLSEDDEDTDNANKDDHKDDDKDEQKV